MSTKRIAEAAADPGPSKSDQERKAEATEDQIPVDPPEEDDDDEDSSEEPSVQTRDDKKRARGQKFKQELENTRRELEEYRSQNQRILGLLESQKQPQPTAPDVSKDQKIQQLNDKRERLRNEKRILAERVAYLGNKITAEQEKEIYARAEQIDDEMADIRADVRDRTRELTAPPKQGDIPEEFKYVRAKYHHVIREPSALRYAQGEYLRLIARPQVNPPGVETFEKAMKSAEAEFRLGNTDVSEGQRRKYSGASTGSGGGAGSQPRTIQMTPHRKKLADEMFGDKIKDPAKRYEHFAKTAGKRIIEREQRRGK